MRKAIVCAVLGLLVLPAVAGATDYVGLFTSSDHTTSAWCPIGDVSLARIEMWIWFLPDAGGNMCAEFGMEYPSNVIATEETYSEIVSIRLGNLDVGVSVCFTSCRPGGTWYWLCHETLWVTSGEETMIRIVPNPSTGNMFIATCEVGYPAEDAVPLIHLYINHASSPMLYCKIPLEIVVGTESVTWGAIKNLF